MGRSLATVSERVDDLVNYNGWRLVLRIMDGMIDMINGYKGV